MRILLPVDGSEHCRNALRFIASRQALSPEKEATVELLNVQHSIPEAVINALGLDSVRKADHMDADLIVMGCRGLSAMEGFFVGSVSAKVISLTKRPLLLVRDKIPAGAMRVGICVDHSDYAHAAAEFVVNQREFFGKDAVFEVINVSETEETFHQAVEPVMTVFEDAGVPAERVHLKGKVGDAICNYAGEGKLDMLDMLVIGSHGYGNFRAAFMGSTAMRITAGCEVPLLVLKA